MVVEALTGLKEYKMLEQLSVGVNPLIMMIIMQEPKRRLWLGLVPTICPKASLP